MASEDDEYELELEALEEPGPSRPLRFLPRGRWLVEVTTRTMQGRYLMRPSPRANAAIRGVLGRALHEHPDVHLVAYWFLSNHYNLLVTVPDAASLSAFMNLVNSLLARELGRIYDWTDKFWSRRYRGIVIVGDRARTDLPAS